MTSERGAGLPVVILDLGSGNLGNLARALGRLGARPVITTDPAAVAGAEVVFLPGVGAFRPARAALRGRLEEAVRAAVGRGAWLFGICLGYQLLFASSDEDCADDAPPCDGLGLLPGRVRALPAMVSRPHIGWNRLEAAPEHAAAAPAAAGLAPLFAELGTGLAAGREYAYFVHSFAPDEVPAELVLATCRHGRPFAAAAGRGRVLGTQFHPEKSGTFGLALLGRFLALAGQPAPATSEDGERRAGGAFAGAGAARAAAVTPRGGGLAGAVTTSSARTAAALEADPAVAVGATARRAKTRAAATPAVAAAAAAAPALTSAPLACQLFPAIDLRRGRVVRLHQGEASRETTYADDPLAVLAGFAAAGATWAHVVDLDAAFGESPQRELLGRLLALGAERGISIELGGGLRDREAIAWALDQGATRVVLGSLAVRDPEAFAALAQEFPGRLVPAIESRGGIVQVSGWREGGGLDVTTAAARLAGLGCPAVLVTDVERDGTLAGPNLALATAVARAAATPALVSGGVATLADLAATAATPGVVGVVVGRALYEGAFSLPEALAAVEVHAARSAWRQHERKRPELGAERASTALARRVIPCLDVAAGRVVKGVRFQALADQGDPAELAARYAAEGADEIVFLDVTAAPDRRATDLVWVERTAAQVFVPLTVGGGVRSVDDARRLLRAGADKVGVNTAAVERPPLIAELATRFGRQCVVLAIDARRVVDTGGGLPTAVESTAETTGEPTETTGEATETTGGMQAGRQVGAAIGVAVGGAALQASDAPGPAAAPPGRRWEVVTHGGRTPTGRDAIAWIREAVALGVGEILLTSIDADGTRDGYDLELLAAAVEAAQGVPVIASGGVGNLGHLAEGLATGASAVLAASIFHRREIAVDGAKAWLAEHGFAIRPPHPDGEIPTLAGPARERAS